MKHLFPSPRTTLLLASACLTTWALLGTAAAEPVGGSVSRLDIAGADTAALTEELTTLLTAAQYYRSTDDPDAPRNSLTSVDRVAEMLRAQQQGVAYVAVAERESDGDRVALTALYRLDGDLTQTAPGDPPAAERAGRAAILVDLGDERGQALLASLQGQLARLQAAATPHAAPMQDVLAALRRPGQVAFLVLGEADAEGAVTASRAIVVPDVVRISIRDDASAAAGAEAGPSAAADADADAEPVPEVELVPHPDGGPPMLKFEFDPRKYDIRKQQ